MLKQMCSNYPEIKLESALGTLEDKIEHLSSYAHIVHTTAKLVISRRRKNENVFKMSKDEICTCKGCKNPVFHCQICKFVGFCCRRRRGCLSSLISPPTTTTTTLAASLLIPCKTLGVLLKRLTLTVISEQKQRTIS